MNIRIFEDHGFKKRHLYTQHRPMMTGFGDHVLGDIGSCRLDLGYDLESYTLY